VTTRAAIYCRISDDRTGQGLGVERQQQDCRALAAAKSYEVVATFIDNDISAYSGKPRKGYLELLDGVAARSFDVIVAWHPDRLHRSPTELEEFISLVERHCVTVETVQAGQWDLSTPSGRMTARQLGAVARYESEHKADRVRRALEQNANKGKSHGRVPYGWDRVHGEGGQARDVVNVVQAAVVQEMAGDIIAGVSIRSIVVKLNMRGEPSPSGRPWAKNMVRAVVIRERNVGLRVHQGEVVGEGTWPAILTPGIHEQVRAILADPTRRTSTSSAAAHLLSGIAWCGVCGGVIRAGQNRTVPSYRCAEHSCVSRNRRDVDNLVTSVVLGRLSRLDAAKLIRPDRSEEQRTAAEEERGLRARLDTAADDYADGKIDARQMERITARLRPQIEAAAARSRIVDDSPLLAGLIGAREVESAWRQMTLSQRRAAIDLLVVVRVMRTKPGARTFDPESVEISWRQ